jgi:hypothetical protein
MRGLRNIATLLVIVGVAAVGMAQAATPGQTTAKQAGAVANPELVGELAKELGSTPQQAEGAAGALFSLAKERLAPADWGKVAAAVPGIDGLLKAAPAASAAPAAGAASAAGAAKALGAGGLASMAGAFSKLGLKPELVAKAVPVLTKFVSKSGGASVGSLLAGVLK